MSKGIMIGAAALFGAVVGGNALFQYGTLETERFTVTEALEVPMSEGGKEKRIKVILENGCPETFTVEDSLWHGQFYSSNLHAIFADAVNTEGRQDNTFEARHFGWRVGMLSWMENIISAERVEGAEPFVVRPDASTACKL